MIVLYIVSLTYFSFNITSIVNVFMLSIERKKNIKSTTTQELAKNTPKCSPSCVEYRIYQNKKSL